MSDKPWKNHIHAAVRHPERPAILLLESEGGPRLPFWQGENLWLSLMGRFNTGLSKDLGASIWGLRQCHYQRDPEQRETFMLLEAELMKPDTPLPPGARWAGLEDLAEAAFDPPELRSQVHRLLNDLAAGKIPRERPPWARPGWLPGAAGWIAGKLSRKGFGSARVEAHKVWGISAVLKIQTENGVCWFKTTHPAMPLFVNEAAITTRLAEMFPNAVPQPLAIDTVRDWMLLPDFDETYEYETPNEVICEMFAKFSRMQIASIPLADDLFAAGAIDRRPAVLRDMIPALMADPAATAQLAPDDRDEILAMEPQFLALLDRLEDYQIPATLLHGDLHPGNAARYQGRMIFFDWTDTSIAHPFFDLMMLNWLDADEAAAVRKAYLEPWETVLESTYLEEAVDLAMALLQLHHAASYHYIVANLEPDAKVELDFSHEFLLEARTRTRQYLEKYPQAAAALERPGPEKKG